jgi:catechol-2,3-dioxygenase
MSPKWTKLVETSHEELRVLHNLYKGIIMKETYTNINQLLGREPIYKGMSRGAMVSHIHMECDTSSFTYKLNNEELIQAYKEIFEGAKPQV